MLDIKKKYMWNEIIEIEEKDKEFFLKLFYKSDIPVKIIGNIICSTYPYAELVSDIVQAHYEGELSDDYYKNRINMDIFKKDKTKSKSNLNVFKVILPIILIMILLMFIRFLFVYKIL